MFHDELITNPNEYNLWHQTYNRLAAAVAVSLKKFLEVLKEVEACANETGKDAHATTLMLMYSFAETIDGVTILIRVGSAKNCPQLLRTAFEIALALLYLLEDDATYERRSLAYEYYHLHDELRWAQKCDPERETGKQLRRELEGDEFADLFDLKGQGVNIKKEIETKGEKVNSPRYSVVRTEIDRIRKAKKKTKASGSASRESNTNWFSLWDGPRDIRSLAAKLKLLSFYESAYRTWSNVTHGEGALKRIAGKAHGGMVYFDAIRSPSRLDECSLHASNLTNMLIRTTAERLVPHLNTSIREWYVSHMKPALDVIRNARIGT